MNKSPRYIIEITIAEIDEDGESIDTIEHSRLLLATENLDKIDSLLGRLEDFANLEMSKMDRLSARDSV